MSDIPQLDDPSRDLHDPLPESGFVLRCFLLGVLVTPLALLLDIFFPLLPNRESLAIAIYPYSHFIPSDSGNLLSGFRIALPLLQFPMYGLILGRWAWSRKWPIVAVFLLTIHGLAAGAAILMLRGI